MVEIIEVYHAGIEEVHHERSSGLYLQGDLYVVAEFMDEIQSDTPLFEV